MPALTNKKTGKTLKSIIDSVVIADYDQAEASGQFVFDWRAEQEREVYKIYFQGEEKEQILGLMSLIDYPEEYRIHLNLIEIATEHQGKDKQIEGIAGCLMAYACQLSFARGYFGFVSLQPKTKLIKWYQDQYGFRQYGRLLAVEQAASNALIKTYLRDEKK